MCLQGRRLAHSLIGRLGLCSSLIVSCALNLQALLLTAVPSFTPSSDAPLAGVLTVTTDKPSRVSVLVNDGSSSWSQGFHDYGTAHSEPLLGFKPGRTNQIWVTVYDPYRNSVAPTQSLSFITGPLPADFPTTRVLVSRPDEMEPGYTLFTVNNPTNRYIAILDNLGQVVWYRRALQFMDFDVRQLDDGNLFIEGPPPANDFVEMDMLGEIVRTWSAPANYPVNIHEGVPTDHGTILYLSDASVLASDFPAAGNPSPPLTTTFVDDNPVVEISGTNGALLNTWSPMAMLDPTRITYLTYGIGSGSAYGVDNNHANAIVDDPSDNSILVSLRNQNAVIKFSRSGQLKWILGPHAGWSADLQPYLLTPVGAPFEWSYGQHAPMITPQGTLLVYDDGNYRASPFDPPIANKDNYSRAVEYAIDETNMVVSEVWDSSWQTNQDRAFTPVVGKVQWLPKRQNVLVTYGCVSYVNGVPVNPNNSQASMVRIKEYTHDAVPKVVFDLSFFDYGDTNASYRGYFTYRSLRIADLYAHPALPVADLTVSFDTGLPFLKFSGDQTRTYVVQASADLQTWLSLGTASPDEIPGEFSFLDADADAAHFATRYYRVLTQ